ncbi:transglycosylase family protein [Streptomyces hainanensis]|uniref:transglycosylase family protein n=1 Tax=Streptomyces hainanensis TaxID=402648 RepID=UPI001FB6D594|nr:transglycosylase family protein [Streptomyces hainanensis]
MSDETWDSAAQCESGGLWSANQGNGRYGGLQLTLDDWERYGGREFAMRPDLASRFQQVTVAGRMLADRGEQAFPGCAVLTGLWPEFRDEPGDDIDWAEEAEEAQAEEEIGGPEDSTTAPTDDATATPDAPTTPADPGTPTESGTGEAAEGSGGAGASGGTATERAEHDSDTVRIRELLKRLRDLDVPRPGDEERAPVESSGATQTPTPEATGPGETTETAEATDATETPGATGTPEATGGAGSSGSSGSSGSGAGGPSLLDIPGDSGGLSGSWVDLYRSSQSGIADNAGDILGDQQGDLSSTGR